MQKSDTIDAIAAALVEVQSEMQKVSKDAKNPFFNSKYADLTSIIDSTRPVLTKHGISVLQLPIPDRDGIVLQTMLMHSSGEWIADEGLHLPAAKNDPQGFGSAVTYARRYALATVLGVAQEDDDANSATAAMSKVEAARYRAAKKVETTQENTTLKDT